MTPMMMIIWAHLKNAGTEARTPVKHNGSKDKCPYVIQHTPGHWYS